MINIEKAAFSTVLSQVGNYDILNLRTSSKSLNDTVKSTYDDIQKLENTTTVSCSEEDNLIFKFEEEEKEERVAESVRKLLTLKSDTPNKDHLSDIFFMS